MENHITPLRQKVWPVLKGYMDVMAGLCAVQFVYALDAEIFNTLDRQNLIFLLANGAEHVLGIGNLLEMIAGWIFDKAAGEGAVSAASGKLGFYLMTPLILASVSAHAENTGGRLDNPGGFSAVVISYFLLYGIGFFIFAALWPAFLWAILFKLNRSYGPVYVKLQRRTWYATLLCFAAVIVALLFEAF